MATSSQGRRIPPTDAKRRALQVEVLDKPRGKRFDRMERLKYCGVFAALLLFGIATAMIVGGRGKASFAPGPVARSHESFEHDCDACHTSGERIFSTAMAIDKWATASDLKCRSCHPVTTLDSSAQGASPHDDQFPIGQHSTREDKTKVRQCAHCHHEHQGIQDLADLDNKTCTECHAALTDFVVGDGPLVDASVKQFEKEHPDFNSLNQFDGKDPGLIKFTHDRHMSLGLVRSGYADPGVKWEDLSVVDRATLGQGDASTSGLVQLSCTSCHKPSGRNMETPTFENNCKACHPLDFDGGKYTVDHGLTASQIHGKLVELLPAAEKPTEVAKMQDFVVIEEATAGRAKLPRPFEPEWPLAAVAKPRKAEDRVAQAEMELRGRCDQCHEPAGDRIAGLELRDVKTNGQGVSAWMIKKTWLQRAHFDHRTHATHKIGCVRCHQGAEPGHEHAHDHNNILIPNRQICTECHHEDSADAADPAMNGGNSCLRCHQYHNEARPANLAETVSDASADMSDLRDYFTSRELTQD